MNEWYLLAGSVVIIFFINRYLRKILHPKTSLIVSSIAFIALLIIFVASLVQHFSYAFLTGIFLYSIMTLFNLVLKYKNLKANT